MAINLKELASKIANQEGKKVQVSIGNVREVIRLVLGRIGQRMGVRRPNSRHKNTEKIWQTLEKLPN